jgi:fatty-acid desaturase
MLVTLAKRWNKLSSIIRRVIVPAHVLLLVGVGTVIAGYSSAHWLWLVYPSWFVLGHIGVGIFIHRYYSHKSFETYDWVARLGGYLGMLAGLGSPVVYKVIHMGYHHPFSDTENDPHTPTKGFWWAYWKWQLQRTEFTEFSRVGVAKSLMRDPWIRFYHNYYYRIYWGSFLLLCLIDWRLAIFTISAGTVLEFHINGLANTFGHLPTRFSYQNYPGNDSQNVPWLNWFTLGLGMHNNHHGKPNQYCLAHKPGEFDISKWIVPLILKKEKK